MSDLDLRYPIGRFEAVAAISRGLREELLGELERLPGDFRGVVARLTAAQLDTPYRDGGWTVRQVVHHVPDSHLNAYVRHRLTVTEEQPTVRGYDEKAWAATPDVLAGEVSVPLALLEAVHARWVAFLRALREDSWPRRFVHGDTGKLWRLDESVAMYAWHGRHHLAQVRGLIERSRW